MTTLTHDDWAIIVEALEYVRRRVAQYPVDVQGQKPSAWKEGRMQRLDATLAKAQAMKDATLEGIK